MRAAPLLVALSALLAFSWTLRLQFQLDDYWIIPTAGAQIKELGRLIHRPERIWNGPSANLPVPETPLFQPTLWTILAAESRVAPRPLKPWIFHLGSLLMHALACTALGLYVRRQAGPLAGLASGLLLAIHPGASQATSWISSGGLVLVVLFGIGMCATIDRGFETGRKLYFLLAGILLGLAGASQIAAISLVPIALVLILIRGGLFGGRILATVLVLLPLVGAAWIRAGYLGTWSLGYLGGTAPTLKVLPQMLGALPRLVTLFLAPTNANPEVADLLPIVSKIPFGRNLFLLPWSILIVAMVLGRPKNEGRRLLISALFFLVLAAPGIYVFSLYQGLDLWDWRVNRTLYPALAGLSATVGLGLGAVHGRWRRPALLAYAAVLILAIDSQVHVSRVEVRAAGVHSERIAAMESAAATVEGGTVFVIDPHVTFAGVPLVSPEWTERALRSPFHAPDRDVKRFLSTRELLDAGTLRTHHGSALVLTAKDGGYAPLSPKLPAVATVLPKLHPAPSPGEGAAAYVPASPLSGRSVAAVKVRAAADGPRKIGIALVTESTMLLRRGELHPGGSEITVAFDDTLDAALFAEIRQVLVQGSSEVPELLTTLPTAGEILSPKDGATLPLSNIPRFFLKGLDPTHALRFHFDVSVGAATYHMTYRANSGSLREGPDGSRMWTPYSDDFESNDHPELRFDRLEALFAVRLRPYGIKRLKMRWRVSILDVSGQVTEARTPFSSFLFVDE